MTMRYKWFVLISVVRISFAQDDYCPEGIYGNNCEFTCPEQCRPLQTFPCNKKTGRCSEGCNEGYYGDQCDKLCSCPSGVCFQENGDCYGTGTATVRSTKNTTKYMIYTTATTSLHNPVCDGVGTAWRTTAIIFIILFFTLLIGVLVMFYNVSRKRKTKEYHPTVAMTREEDSLLQEKREEPDLEAAGGDQPEEKPQVFKGSTEVEDLRQKNQKLKDELQVFKGSTEVEELRQENQRLKDERDRAEAKCEEMKKHVASLEFQDKENQRLLGLPVNSKNHLMENDKWLQCPNLKFDRDAVNVKVAQIDDNSVLWNTPDTWSRGNKADRFQNFHGTTCTEPLVKSGFYQYFEVVFDIHLKQPIENGEVVIQLGFCMKTDRDKTPFVEMKKKCFLVEVVNCKIHNKICLVSINIGKTEHIQELMNNVEGSSQRVMIGIRLDKSMKQIKVYDGLKFNVLHKTHINIGENIWPMFGVCDEKNASVSVQLKVGDEIPMKREKKERLKSEKM